MHEDRIAQKLDYRSGGEPARLRIWPVFAAVPVPTLLVAAFMTAVEWPVHRRLANNHFYQFASLAVPLVAGVLVLRCARMRLKAFFLAAAAFSFVQFCWLMWFVLCFGCWAFHDCP